MRYTVMALLGLFFSLSAQAQCIPGQVTQHAGKHRSFKTGYFPYNDEMQGGYFDRKGKPLQTLQRYLRGQAAYVSVAMDHTDRRFPYGTMLRIPQLEKIYGRCILFRVVDTGGAFVGRGASKIDLCNENESAAYAPHMQGWTEIFVVPRGLK